MVIILFLVIIIGATVSTKRMTENQDEICEKIARNSGLEFLGAGKGKCGWGEACDFQCRLLNSKGEVVVRNYP